MYSENTVFRGEEVEIVSLQVKRGERGSTFYINVPKKLVAKMKWRPGDKLALIARGEILFIKKIEIKMPREVGM